MTVPQSIWTVDSLLALVREMQSGFCKRLDALEAAMATAITNERESRRESFAASEKAIEKAEVAQKDYNVLHNDLVRKMDDQHKATLPRSEADLQFENQNRKFKEIDEKLETLRIARGNQQGQSQGLAMGWAILLGALTLFSMLLNIYLAIK